MALAGAMLSGRVNLVYASASTGAEVELPLRILVMGDYTLRLDATTLAKRKPFDLGAGGVEGALATLKPHLALRVPDRLSPTGGEIEISATFRALSDFAPDNLARLPALAPLLELRSAVSAVKGPLGGVQVLRRKLQEMSDSADAKQRLDAEGGMEAALDALMKEGSYWPEELHALARRGFRVLFEALARGAPDRRYSSAVVDEVREGIDRRLSDQLSEILHHPDFQRLESAWRGLAFLVRGVDFSQNIRLELLSVSQEELGRDFARAPTREDAGLAQILQRRADTDAVLSGQPYGLVCANYAFGSTSADLALLGGCAAVAATSQTPFIANASPALFGESSFVGLLHLSSPSASFAGPAYTEWRSFRECDEAGYVGLCLPRFLLRQPYGEKTTPLESFAFEERTAGQHDRYLWGHASLALTSRIAASFAKFRWAPNILGPVDGLVEGLPDAGDAAPLVEAALSERREYELSEEGLIPLYWSLAKRAPYFSSANSARKPRSPTAAGSPVVSQPDLEESLDLMLPWRFVTTRIAHYLDVVAREHVTRGRRKGRHEVERGLIAWLERHVAAADERPQGADSGAVIRAYLPFKARLELQDLPTEPGWCRLALQVQPTRKWMGRSFTLSLTGKLRVEGLPEAGDR